MSMTYAELAASAFFQWFGVQQRDILHAAVVICEPGGYQEHVELRFALDEKQKVTRAELILDRAWMEEAGTAPFAADITKSFILTFAGGDRASLALGRQLELMLGSFPGVLSGAHSADPMPEDLQDVVSPALDVYAGRAVRAAVEALQHQLVLTNDNVPDRPRLYVTWIAAPDAGGKDSPNGLLARVRRLLHA